MTAGPLASVAIGRGGETAARRLLVEVHLSQLPDVAALAPLQTEFPTLRFVAAGEPRPELKRVSVAGLFAEGARTWDLDLAVTAEVERTGALAIDVDPERPGEAAEAV